MRTPDAQQLFDFYRNATRLARSMAARAERVLPDDVTMPRFELLDLLAGETTPVSPMFLANKQHLTPAAVTHLLKHLDRSGWLEIMPDPYDGRAKRVALSEDGRGVHRDCMIALSGLTTRLLSELSATGAADANAMLVAFAQGLENDDSGA